MLAGKIGERLDVGAARHHGAPIVEQIEQIAGLDAAGGAETENKHRGAAADLEFAGIEFRRIGIRRPLDEGDVDAVRKVELLLLDDGREHRPERGRIEDHDGDRRRLGGADRPPGAGNRRDGQRDSGGKYFHVPSPLPRARHRPAFVYNSLGMVLDKRTPFKTRAMDGGELSRPTGADSTVPTADLQSRDFRKILLIKLSAVGDVVHTLPVLNKLRRRYPEARLDWLVRPAIAELLRQNPAITNVIEFSREEWSRPWRMAPFVNSARLVATLRAARYDLVLDLQGQLRSAVLAFASGAPVRIGFDRPRAALWNTLARKLPAEAKKHAWQGAREGSFLAYTHHIALPTLDAHPVERYLGVAPMLGLDEGAADFSFPIPPEATARIDALLDYYGLARTKLLAMAPGTNWQTKQWRGDGFAEVARHFLHKGFGVILIGSDRERGTCEDVAAPGAGDGQPRRRNHAVRARGAHSPHHDLRHQRFRADASCGRARPAGRSHIRADRYGMGRPLPARRRGAAHRAAVLAVLFARTAPLQFRPRLHARASAPAR